MTHARTVLPAAALALALAPSAFAGGPPPPTVIRADCVHEVSAPTRIVLACGDANAVLTGITWSKWGGALATATATLNANTCDPSCAGGTFKAYPVTVRADRRRRCSGATFGYARLRIAYTGDRPAGAGPVTR